MPIERSRRIPVFVVLFTSLGGCASASTRNDLVRVRELAHSPLPRGMDASDVDPVTSTDVRRALSRLLTVNDAVRVALLNNRALRATLRELGISRGRLIQAGLIPNPGFEVELLPERNSRFEVRAEYDLKGLLLAPRRASVARMDLDAARYAAAGEVVRLGFEVRAAFYAFAASEQRLAAAKKTLDALVAGRDAARALYDAGNVAELERATQEAAYERARVAVAELELEVASGRERLHRLLGLHGEETRWRAREGLAPVPDHVTVTKDAENRAIEASLELGHARSRLESLARRSGLVHAEGWIPDVSVDVHGLYGNPDESHAPLAGNNWRFGAGVALTLPFFDRQQGRLLATEAEFDGQLERYQGLAIDVRSAVRDARNRLVSAHARARAYQTTIVPAIRRVLDQTLLQYNAMQVGVFDLLRARRDVLSAELAYFDVLREFWTAQAALDATLAGIRVPLPEIAPRNPSFSLEPDAQGAGGHR